MQYLACTRNGKYPSDVYRETKCFLDISTPRGIAWNGAERCGITAPGYAEKATYRVGLEIFVYDAGLLIPVNEWYASPAATAMAEPTPEAKPRTKRTRKGGDV